MYSENRDINETRVRPLQEDKRQNNKDFEKQIEHFCTLFHGHEEIAAPPGTF